MYLYAFSHFAWHDRVFEAKPELATQVSPWDLITSGGAFFLVLWERVAWIEQYEHIWQWTQCDIVRKSFFRSRTLRMMHWMAYHWFTQYKKIIPLYIPADLEKTLSRRDDFVKKKKKHLTVEIVVFPDVWTMANYRCDDGRVPDLMLTSQDSAAKQQKAWWQISLGTVSRVFVVWSQIFRDWWEIESCELVDRHIWYYASQQDPRYKVQTVVTEMQKVYGISYD